VLEDGGLIARADIGQTEVDQLQLEEAAVEASQVEIVLVFWVDFDAVLLELL